MCQHEEIRSLKRSNDTSGIGKREPVTRINVISRRRKDKDRKKKTWPTRGSNSVVLPVVTVGPGRNDRRPGDKGLSTKSLAYRRGKS